MTECSEPCVEQSFLMGEMNLSPRGRWAIFEIYLVVKTGGRECCWCLVGIGQGDC